METALLLQPVFGAPVGGSKGTYLVDSSDGSILAFLPTTALEYSPPSLRWKIPAARQWRWLPTGLHPTHQGRHDPSDRAERRERPMGVRSISGDC